MGDPWIIHGCPHPLISMDVQELGEPVGYVGGTGQHILGEPLEPAWELQNARKVLLEPAGELHNARNGRWCLPEHRQMLENYRCGLCQSRRMLARASSSNDMAVNRACLHWNPQL